MNPQIMSTNNFTIARLLATDFKMDDTNHRLNTKLEINSSSSTSSSLRESSSRLSLSLSSSPTLSPNHNTNLEVEVDDNDHVLIERLDSISNLSSNDSNIDDKKGN